MDMMDLDSPASLDKASISEQDVEMLDSFVDSLYNTHTLIRSVDGIECYRDRKKVGERLELQSGFSAVVTDGLNDWGKNEFIIYPTPSGYDDTITCVPKGNVTVEEVAREGEEEEGGFGEVITESITVYRKQQQSIMVFPARDPYQSDDVAARMLSKETVRSCDAFGAVVIQFWEKKEETGKGSSAQSAGGIANQISLKRRRGPEEKPELGSPFSEKRVRFRA